MLLCTSCGGSGNKFRKADSLRKRFRICCKCHGTGNQHASHTLVLAVKAERDKN